MKNRTTSEQNSEENKRKEKMNEALGEILNGKEERIYRGRNKEKNHQKTKNGREKTVIPQSGKVHANKNSTYFLLLFSANRKTKNNHSKKLYPQYCRSQYLEDHGKRSRPVYTLIQF